RCGGLLRGLSGCGRAQAVARMKRTGRRGTVLIEAALTLPILFYLTLGVIEYGWMLLKAQQIANAAQAGVRAGALADGTAASVNSAISGQMTQFGIAPAAYSTLLTPNDPSTLTRGGTFSVQITVTYSSVAVLGSIPMIPTPTTL